MLFLLYVFAPFLFPSLLWAVTGTHRRAPQSRRIKTWLLLVTEDQQGAFWLLCNIKFNSFVKSVSSLTWRNKVYNTDGNKQTGAEHPHSPLVKGPVSGSVTTDSQLKLDSLHLSRGGIWNPQEGPMCTEEKIRVWESFSPVPIRGSSGDSSCQPLPRRPPGGCRCSL